MLRHAVSDPASVIPQAIYHEWVVNLPLPGTPVVFAHPEDVRAILLDKDEVFGRNRELRTLMRRAWGKGLAASEGEGWARQHRAAAPVFRPAAVERFAPIMADVVRRVAGQWDISAPIALDPMIGRIVAEIVMCTLLTGAEDADFDQLAADIPHFVRLVSTFGTMDMLPIPEKWLDWLRGMGRSPQEARLRAIVEKLADKRAHATANEEPQDFPAAMRGAGPLADNMLGTLPAGFETTARAAGWAIYLLARSPAWQDAVRAEALATHNASALSLTRQVVQEAMRLYPPAPILVRSTLKPIELRGQKLQKGQVAIIATYAMHRHRLLWERPDSFDPSRFAPDASYNRNAFLPFGAGPRMCIAAQFAQTEIAVIVAELVKLYRFMPSGEDPDISLVISTHAKNGLWVRAERV